MDDVFSAKSIKKTYLELKNRKKKDRNKKLPIGCDGMSSAIFDRKLDQYIFEIERKLRAGADGESGYSFGPLLRLEKSKSNGGIRVLHVPRLRDQIVLRLIHDEVYKAALNSGLVLKMQSPYKYVNRFDQVMNGKSDAFVVKTDISMFYDTVKRSEAIACCADLRVNSEVMALLRKWDATLSVRTTSVLQTEISHNFYGLPQGVSLSSLLAELYARKIDNHFTGNTGYFRYVDDIIMVCESYQEALLKLQQLQSVIDNLGLRLSPLKTMIVPFSDGLEWLGLIHYPDRKVILDDKLNNWIKPFASMHKNCMAQLVEANSKREKELIIRNFINTIRKFVTGPKSARIRWYAMCEDKGQWKAIDRYIHNLIRSSLRKAGIEDKSFPELPSVHGMVYAHKKQKESQKLPDKGNAPTV